jgi:hypothetical protein
MHPDGFDRGSSRPHKIANGFVAIIGHPDRRQFSGAM